MRCCCLFKKKKKRWWFIFVTYFFYYFYRLGNKEENLSLLKFNLEPLTDTLQVLLVRDNGLTGLPNQFIRRNFPRLRHLDISHNDIQSNYSSGRRCK